MSHAPQLPEHPCSGDASSEQAAVPSISRVSCTAHLMPNRCISLFVEISESMWCPLIISVSDNPITKNPTAKIEIPITINQLGIILIFYNYKFVLSAANLYICRLKCKNVALGEGGKSQTG